MLVVAGSLIVSAAIVFVFVKLFFGVFSGCLCGALSQGRRTFGIVPVAFLTKSQGWRWVHPLQDKLVLFLRLLYLDSFRYSICCRLPVVVVLTALVIFGERT